MMRILYIAAAAVFFLLCGLTLCCQNDAVNNGETDYNGFNREERAFRMVQSVRRDPLGRKVLALYKSTDKQTEQENEVRYHLQDILVNMGLSLEYWDIDAGIPGTDKLQNVRAIISWFRGASMADPEAYLDFVDRAVSSGVKFVVVGNFGAFQYRLEQDKFVEPARLNLTLSRLGLWYNGNWTDDASLLEIVTKDPAVVEANGRQDVNVSAFYYFFQVIDRDLDVYLSVRRTDKDLPPSPFVVTNRNGGFVLSNYIYHLVNGQPVMLIDFSLFLRNALFPRAKQERIGILADLTHPQTKDICLNIAEQLKRTQSTFEVIEKKDFAKLVPGDLARYTAVALILPNTQDLNPEVIADYYKNGGSLVSLYGGYFVNIAPYLASVPSEEQEAGEGIGYHLRPDLLLSRGFVMQNENLGWGRGNLLPAADAVVLGTANDTSQPIVWASADGRVLTWNWHAFANPELVGLAFESFLRVRPVGAAATLGFAHLFIDDCPLPMYNVKKDPLPDVTDTDFYLKTWWPDIKQILDEYGIPVSSYIIFNYNARVEPPFTGAEFFAAENLASLELAKIMFAQNVDMGLHGYNHMSLTREPTEVNKFKWASIQYMEDALKEGKRYWTFMLPRASLPFSYVAPNNIISQEGVIALHSVFPTIKVISCMYWSQNPETTTEMAPNPQFPDLYYLPRISSGYLDTYDQQNLIAAGAGALGVISHFIHPDDVYDEDRSAGRSWQELKKAFRGLLDFISYHYPWIQWVDIRQAYYRLEAQDEAQFSFRWLPGAGGANLAELVVRTVPGQLFRIRPNTYTLTGAEGAEIIYSYANMPGIILKARKEECILSFKKK
jgi:hypothetical protein